MAEEGRASLAEVARLLKTRRLLCPLCGRKVKALSRARGAYQMGVEPCGHGLDAEHADLFLRQVMGDPALGKILRPLVADRLDAGARSVRDEHERVLALPESAMGNHCPLCAATSDDDSRFPVIGYAYAEPIGMDSMPEWVGLESLECGHEFRVRCVAEQGSAAASGPPVP